VPSRAADLKFWRVTDGSLESTIEKAHQDTITGLAFSPDGARLASGSTDRFVKIHHAETGELLNQLEGHTNHVLDVAWSADGETIVSAGADHVAKLWVAAEGRQKKTEEGFKKELTSIAFLGVGEGLLIGSGDKIVKAAGQNLGGIEDFVYDVAATPDGSTIIAGGEDGVLRVWNASDRKLLHSFVPPTSP
jgi:WD40 repeat protein